MRFGHDGISSDDCVAEILERIADDSMIYGFAFGVDDYGQRYFVLSTYPRRLFAPYEPDLDAPEGDKARLITLECAAIATLSHSLNRVGLKAQEGSND